jgi:polysaccharide deacetylase family protein (PEP-CTERM system associated)
MGGNRQKQAKDLVHALSFDVEDWFHMHGIEGLDDHDTWDSLPSLVEHYTSEILQVCSDADVKATFFVVGWVAERYPNLVAEIVAEGHELGTHSHLHRMVTDLDSDEFTSDLKRSIAAIEFAGGAAVRGFRAPSFSIRPGTEWALEAVLELGLEFDASLYPVTRRNSGYPAEPGAHMLGLESGNSIRELPMSVLPLGPLSTRFSGGGYLRLMPMPLIKWGMDRLASRDLPTVVYMHPRDFAEDVPTADLEPMRRFAAKVGTNGARQKLAELLRRYRWAPCGEVLALAMSEAG